MPALHLRGTILPSGEARDVFVADGRITFAEPEGDVESLLDGGFLLPGLVDVHAHLASNSPAPPGSSPEETVRASARAHLDAGVLAIREPGSRTVTSRGIGPAEGLPRVVTAGRFLATPGGFFPGAAREVGDQELPDAAVEEAAASGGWAKVIGDFTGGEGRLAANFSGDALYLAAERVHAAGGRIAIHANVPEVLEGAIDASFDSIEHGVFLEPHQLARMAERDIAYVPTLVSLSAAWPGYFDRNGLDPGEIRRVARRIELLPAVVAEANDLGVTVLAGTDGGVGPHGKIREEIARLAGAGLSHDVALGAASWRARRFLGLPGIEDGAPADLVAYPRDPREDGTALDEPAVVILDGQVLRR